jgi:hypothetical protein
MTDLWEDDGFGRAGGPPDDGDDDWDEGDEKLDSDSEDGFDDPSESDDEEWDDGEE